MGRLGHVGRAARAVIRHPRDGLEETWEEVCGLRERPAPEIAGLPSPNWEKRLHELLGVPWPCQHAASFEPMWRHIQSILRQEGLRTGRGAYGGWDDGDPGLARAVWCAAGHLEVQRAVETGVARGITSRTILESLAREGRGRLWSIDLAPLHRSDLDQEIGVVVPSDRRDRWTLIEGSSRHQLSRLLERLGGIDLFVHDSLHSERNVRFELEHAWPFLRPGGAAIVDDVHLNAGFHAWAGRSKGAESLICLADDRSALFAIALKRSGPAIAGNHRSGAIYSTLRQG
jgi:hypothetical protein